MNLTSTLTGNGWDVDETTGGTPVIQRNGQGQPIGLIDPDTGLPVGGGSGSVAVNPATGRIEDAVQRGAVAEVSFVSLAQSLDEIIVGAITRDANGAAISATLAWPDGGTGAYTATQVSSAFPGAVDAYTCTYSRAGVNRTYTQPAVTRDANGAVTNKPAMTVA